MDHTNYFFSVLPPFLEGTFLMEAGRGVDLASFVFSMKCSAASASAALADNGWLLWTAAYIAQRRPQLCSE